MTKKPVSRQSYAPRPSPVHARFIKDLGGPTEVANHITQSLPEFRGRSKRPPLTPQAVSMWLNADRGIPYRYRAVLAILAREKGVSAPRGFLGEPTRRNQPSASA